MEPAPVRLRAKADDAREREAYLGAAFSAMPEGVMFARYPERTIVDVNDALLRMTGYAREDLVGRDTRVLHLDDARFAEFGKAVLPRFEAGEPARLEWPLRRKDGSTFLAEVTVTPLAPFGGASVGVVCVLRDVDEERRLADERRRLEAQDAFLAQNSIDLISRTSLDGILRYVSPSALAILGYEPREMVGRPGEDFLHPDDYAAARERQAGKGGAPVTHLQRVRHKDGRWVWMESVARIVPGADGKPREVLAVARDVTERQRQAEALERSEATWRGLAQSAPGYLFTMARDGTILFINRVAPGVRFEDIVGHNQYDRFAPEDRERIRALQEAVFETGQPTTYEARADTKAGTRWFENHVGPIVEKGEVVALTVLTIDVTERKTAEAERARTQAFLEAVLAQLPSGVVLTDAKGAVLRTNARMQDFTGGPRHFDLPDIDAYAAWEGKHPDGSPILPDEWPLSRALLDGEVVRGQEVSLRVDGRDVWCRVSAAPVRDAEGRIVAGVAIVDDVTDKKASEDALRESEAQWRRLIDVQSEMGDAIVVGVDGRIAWANEAYQRLTGYARDEPLAPGFRALGIEPPTQGLARTERTRETYETTLTRKDGVRVVVEVSVGTEVREGRVHATAVIRDIADRKRQQEELEQARAQLARSEKLSALGSLVAGVAHELRTPLTYLATNLDLVDRAVERILADLPQERRDAARARLAPRLMDAREGMDRINRLVEDLRKFTKLRESGDLMSLDLAPIVDEAVGLFRATRRGDVRVVDELRPTPLRHLDRVQIQQVVLNLLENAREAKPRDGVVRVRTFPDEEGRPVLEVEDDGPGIPMEVQARMWDPFFTTKPDGSGLGLAIVKRIADTHGATVSCRSVAGQGTTFRLTFR